jgi:subtilisin family serine protease
VSDAGISVNFLRILLVSGLLACASAWPDPALREGGTLSGLQLAGTEDPQPKVFIVQLRGPAAAEHFANVTMPQSGKLLGNKKAAARAFSKNDAEVQSYAAGLEEQQERVFSRIGTGAQKIYGYQYSLNGFAARMSVAEAHKLAQQSEVLKIWEDEVRPLATNHSAVFLGLFQQTVGLRGTPGLNGEDIVIGVIDSGIAPEHPALSDKRTADRPKLCRTSWADNSLLGLWLCRRYKKMPDVLNFQPPENWTGICESGERFTAGNCNNKLIGARYFVDGAMATGPIDEGEIFSPRDADGHGTHTATTAAGNKVKSSIFGTLLGNVEGMAPRARIAAYKACWVRPGETKASCNTSDLAFAIDAAVADGVDIINYSVGSSLTTLTAPDDVALMAATKAGVLTVVAAGNEGPNYSTIGSPAGGPWVITTGASSRDGQHSLEALQIDAPAAIAGKYAVKEASFTPPLKDRDPIDAKLVLVDDDDDMLANGDPGTTFDACEPLVNDTEISGNVAFIQRGGCTFELKVVNAQDAGAKAVVVFSIAGDPTVMTGVSGQADIPALMIGQADGNLILAQMTADTDVEVILDKGFFLSATDTGNVMGAFSARGPAPVPDILKPDVTAPGINILAGFTPDAANSVPDENFAFLTGTSMSAPHVAGVAALLRQAHPDWSPAAIKSALMTTARQDVRQQDGRTEANPFDFGSGHIVPNAANDPGLVYDISDDEYDAFACGIESPAIDQQRCDELASAGISLATTALNQPNIVASRMTNTVTITRRVTNVSDESESYLAEVVAPSGMSVQVFPVSLNVPPGMSASFDVTITYESGPLDLWRFGSLTWTSNRHSVRSVIATRPVSLTAPVEVKSAGGTGSISVPVAFGYDGTYSPGVHGLDRAFVTSGFVDNDPTKTFTFREINGVTLHRFTVPADQLYLRFALFDQLTDGNDDLDMYLYYCPDNVLCSKVGESGEKTSREQIDVLVPGAGTYLVFIHGFETDQVAGGPGSNYQLLAWQIGVNDNVGNMTATAPATVTSGSTHDITVNWSGLGTDSVYMGAISHNTPQGLVAITLISIQN